MIIKSLSRATKSFEALYNYLTRDNESILNTFNLYSNPYNSKELISEFLDNAEYLKRARGKNYLYHEIISLNKNSLTLKEQENILSDLVSKYISLRAENHLTFTALHKDKDHIHIHLMISANELMGDRRVRLSKKDFSSIQKELEQYSNSTYPQLGETTHYQKKPSQYQNKKEKLQAELKKLFEQSKSKEAFKSSCEMIGLEFYTRGKTVGVIYESKKYRLKTLGLLESYQELMQRVEADENEKSQQEQKVKEEKKAHSNENETKIKSRREAMKKIRENQEQESRTKA